MNKDLMDKTSAMPLYQQLKKVLEEQIKSGQLKLGDMIPSEKSLCELYGISQITARKAIFELVNMGFLYRVPGKGTFVASPAPRQGAIMPLKTDNIGFVISREHHPIFSNSFYSFVFKGVEEEARAHGYDLFYQILDQKLMADPSSFKLIVEKKVDGLLLVGEMPHNFVFRLKEEDIPLVLVDHYIKEAELDAVVTDNEKGTYQVMKYLVDLGHTKIGFLGASLGHGTFMERFRGYKSALKNFGIKYNEDFVQTGLLWDGYAIMDKIFRKQKLPTAIFACNDLMAIKAMAAICDRELRVPDDISVAGFDDIEMSSQIHPPLTTVRVQREQMGALAIRKLIGRIRDKSRYPKKTVLPTELVVRKSCKTVSRIKKQEID